MIKSEYLHPDTYVSTINGAIKAKDISEGQKLIGRDGSPVEIKEKLINNSEGFLIDIKAMGMERIKMTSNCSLLVCKPKRIRVKRKEPKITRTREYSTYGCPNCEHKSFKYYQGIIGEYVK